jgi:hypothetical protein
MGLLAWRGTRAAINAGRTIYRLPLDERGKAVVMLLLIALLQLSLQLFGLIGNTPARRKFPI